MLYPEVYKKFESQICDSHVVKDYCEGLAMGFESYLSQYNKKYPNNKKDKKDFLVVVVVDEEETNLFDIYNIQITLRDVQ